MLLLNVCICSIIFLVGYNLKRAFPGFSKADIRFLDKLFFHHFIIAIVFYFYVSIYGGDATFYWDAPKTISFEEIINLIKQGSASGVIYLINYIPSKVLNLSFFTGNMSYALLGYLGFIYFYRISKNIFKEKSSISGGKIFGIPIFPWIWFLPNLHFWSSGIGKDSILFFSIAVFMYSLQNIKRNWLGLFISLILSLSIRPHITLFLLVAFGIGYFLDGNLKGYQKVIIFLFFIAGFTSIFAYVLQFIQLESLDAQAISEYTSTKALKLNKITSGSGVDISGYPFPAKVATFLYRPLFFDINGIMAILASFENLVLLIFTFIVIKNKPMRAFKKGDFLIKGMLIFFLIGTMSFSLILGNLGIMLRQKNMFIPVFIIFGFWTLYNNKLLKNTK